MIPLLKTLKPLFSDEELSDQFTKEQVDVFYNIYLQDFVTNPLIINGKQIRVETRSPKPKEFSGYQETFFHIVTRKVHLAKARFYECKRANRIHWIKPILLNHPCEDILYYLWRDNNGVCKEHYWYFKESFMVVLVNIEPDKQIVTSFCVDDNEKLGYYAKYKDFIEGRCDCHK